jgi:hypothetical protein
MAFRNAYSKHKRVQVLFVDENGDPEVSRTKQAHKDECDINRILAQMIVTGKRHFIYLY